MCDRPQQAALGKRSRAARAQRLELAAHESAGRRSISVISGGGATTGEVNDYFRHALDKLLARLLVAPGLLRAAVAMADGERRGCDREAFPGPGRVLK